MLIVRGSTAFPGQFPYQVSLRLYGQHFCGGILITKKHVVTAAHCIHGTVSFPFTGFTVVTGSVSLASGGHTHLVAAATYHPAFEPDISESFKNDVAVVTLADEVSIDQYQSPISLATSDPPVGAALTMSGWGQTTTTKRTLPEYLRTATVYLLSNEVCQEYISQYRIYPGQMCTFKEGGVGACLGDSGGPLVYDGSLVGIVSWVFPCAVGLPDAFTRVTSYVDFITRTVEST
ncbi:Chymotrypsin-2 [Habropoda laboriosa]|uniref:Chymotrypsin-2 n=2 Tax=Habropoda laboriosa TaxID=597456 RepID=A0A0L7QUU7_9HYME|nr:Chymotrypsin-2 [Habropoda laboriosa]